MRQFYSNLVLCGPQPQQAVAWLKAQGRAAYVSPMTRGAIVIFHEDLSSQEDLARQLSAHFACPALLAMGYGPRILLYHLYEAGEQTDAYVSSPHDELDLGHEPAPQGNPSTLCKAFNAERNERRIETILRKESRPGHAYEHAINRHGELLRALGLPLLAAGGSFAAIDLGEMPAGPEFDVRELLKA